MRTMGTLQRWICVFASLWNLNMCNTDIPNRFAKKMVSTNDSALTSNNGSLCQNVTVPRNISFQRLTIDDNILYIGATNRILQINLPEFTIDQVAVQGPIDDNPACFGPHMCSNIPSCELLDCVDNFNRLLLPHRDQLIVCGSADFGTCDLLPLKNISKTFMPRPYPTDAMKCTGVRISQIAKVGGPMTVASIFNSNESSLKDVFYLGSRDKSPYMVEILYPPRTTPDGSKLKFLKISKSPHFDVNTPKNFLLSWTTPLHGFMLWSTNVGITKLGRLCHTSLNEDPDQLKEGQYSKTSYTEITIQCGDFTKGTLAYQVNEVLYILMENSEGHHALCSTNFSSINDHFLQVRTDCLNGTLKISLPDGGAGTKCKVKKNVEKLAECGLSYGASNFAKAIKSTENFKLNIRQRSLWPDGQFMPTTFAIQQFDGWEVGFFGTVNGTILKTDINQLGGGFVESITLENNVPVQLDVGFDKSATHFYAMNRNAVYQIKVSSCEQYDDCEACVGSGDPYCGWCVLQSQCTTKTACANSLDGQRWMDVSRDQAECPRVAAVQPSTLSIRVTKMISLTFAGNMVAGVNYTCSFNINGLSVGRSPLTNFPTSPTCQSPRNPPAVPDGQDYMDVTLEIEAGQAVVAKGNFSIYDCSRTPFVNDETMCASCVTSRWNCEWCSTSTSCSDNCTNEIALNDKAFCPSVVRIVNSSIDIPVGRDHEFTVRVRNLTVSNYDCVINVCDGASKVITPAVLDGNTVICTVAGDKLRCNDEDSMVSIHLQSGNHIVDTETMSLVQVNLFNCSGSKAECGLCVLTHQRHPECSWCANENVCIPTEDCSDAGNTEIASCPTARIDNINPQNGPIDGGTEITITGTNLATSLEEISGLFVKHETSGIDVNCIVVPEKYVPSKRIVCMTASTAKPVKGYVHINISYATEDVVSTEEFEFKDVDAKRYTPQYALKGTELTIDGKNLDVGNGAKIKLTGKLKPRIKDCPNRTSNHIRCIVPNDTQSGSYGLTTVVDGYEVLMDGQLTFVKEPTIQDLKGRDTFTSFNSGGIKAEFEFSSLHGIQSVVLSVNNGKHEECELIQDRTSVICPIPSLEAAEAQSLRRSKRQDSGQANPSGVARKNIQSKLIINGVTEIPLEDKFQLSYVADPVIYDLQQFCSNPKSAGDGSGTSANGSMVLVHLTGKHLADAAVADDYIITINGLKDGTTSVKCDPSSITSELLSCRSSVEKMQKYRGMKVGLSIKSGNFTRVMETEYCPGSGSAGFSIEAIVAIVAVVVVLIVIIVILIFLQRRRAQKQQKEREQIMKLLDKLENKTRENARKAYFELQLGYMTTFTEDIGDSITYISPISCFMKALFNNWKSDHPMLASKKIENVPTIKLSGVDEFAALLKNKEFLILLVKTLEEQKHFTVKEKGQFASLLTVCLLDDMVYYTRVMMELLSELIQKHVGKNPKLLLRRSESVVEKMVSHWLCITLYSECIRGQAGKPLFLMTKAIHFLVSSAPCDVVANKAVNSLNEMTLLGTEVTYEAMTLRASVMLGEKRSDVFEVKVVNCDTITQVKEKVIEVFYRDKPYSECPKPDKLQLEFLVGGQGNLILSDVDHMSHKQGNYTRINTLRHYNVLDGAEITLSPAKEDATEQAAEAGSPPPEPKKKRLYHLIDPHDKETNGAVEEDDGGKGTKALIGNLINQPFQEIFLTRMVKSKSTVQEYVDNVFNAILNPNPMSRCVKYLFQFLDKEAIKHKISDAEVLHIWKNNSLLLRYWVNILKNPEFLFDVNTTAIVDSCLNVITQAFMDACTTTSHKLGQDSPSNKLLYAKDSAKYKEMVAKFFVNVSNEESVSDGEITEILKDTSRKYAKEFNKQAAALELFKYVDKYRSQILEAVENESLYSRLNETIRKISPDTNGHQTAYETSILV